MCNKVYHTLLIAKSTVFLLSVSELSPTHTQSLNATIAFEVKGTAWIDAALDNKGRLAYNTVPTTA